MANTQEKRLAGNENQYAPSAKELEREGMRKLAKLMAGKDIHINWSWNNETLVWQHSVFRSAKASGIGADSLIDYLEGLH